MTPRIVLAASLAEAEVKRLEITRREPFVAGQTFDSVGAYEKVVEEAARR